MFSPCGGNPEGKGGVKGFRGIRLATNTKQDEYSCITFIPVSFENLRCGIYYAAMLRLPEVVLTKLKQELIIIDNHKLLTQNEQKMSPLQHLL